MLVAFRLAGLSALGAHYAGDSNTQCRADADCSVMACGQWRTLIRPHHRALGLTGVGKRPRSQLRRLTGADQAGRGVIKIAITVEALDGIASTLPLGSVA